MPHPLIEAFGRPTWREVRALREAADLRVEPLPPPKLDPATPVVVAPGFFGSERSLDSLVEWLGSGGAPVRVAELDLNRRGSDWATRRIIDTLEASLEHHAAPAVLIGHSRGGQQGRVASVRRPELVARLVTLGAPFHTPIPRHFVLRGAVESLRFAARLGLYRPEDIAGDDRYAEELQLPFDVDVPFTSIYSRSDGFVAWQQCIDPAATCVEVDVSHRGLVESRPAFAAIATALTDEQH